MEKSCEEIISIFLNARVREKTHEFLKRYWLTEVEYKGNCEPIMDKIFHRSFEHLPDILYKREFKIAARRGGTLFTKNEYYLLQKFMEAAGDKFFVIIENKFIRKKEDGGMPYLKFKFPIHTTWTELNNGDKNYPDIAYDLLWVMDKEFFIFSDSGKWGRYAACDYYDTPINVIGFKPELESVFHENFKQTKKEQDEVMDCLPTEYKNLVTLR